MNNILEEIKWRSNIYRKTSQISPAYLSLSLFAS